MMRYLSCSCLTNPFVITSALGLACMNLVGISQCDSDLDGDGWTIEAGDCNDNDATVYPGATEYCDKVDNNCDGTIDNDAEDAPTWFEDIDGDGFGTFNNQVSSCTQPEGYAPRAGDCDDRDPNIHPGATEVPDGQDNNCDGEIDETNQGIGQLVINEVDYDQYNTDTMEYLELFNAGNGAMNLQNLAIVLVNGANSSEYWRFDLSALVNLQAGGYLVFSSSAVTVPEGVDQILFANESDNIQNGAPDGIALVDVSTQTVLDALSYEGAITEAYIQGFDFPINLVEGTPVSEVDSNTDSQALARLPNGTDSNDADTDWTLTSVLTPGSENVVP